MRLPLAILFAASGIAGAQVETLPFDHVHLNVSSADSAFRWYMKTFGGTANDEAPNRINYGSTRLMFLPPAAAAKPSAGGAIDHIGFSVADLDAKMKEFEAAGIKVVTPMRDVQGLFKLAFIEDPWGTKIEVVQDSALLGFHHVHLRAPAGDSTLAWLTANFGGERTKLKGRLDAVKYSAAGFSDVWILVQAGAAEPSTGRAIDHIGWRVKDLDAKVKELSAKNVGIETQPRPLTLANRTTIRYSYVVGPSGTRIELVQR